jgi:hypothetical protein
MTGVYEPCFQCLGYHILNILVRDHRTNSYGAAVLELLKDAEHQGCLGLPVLRQYMFIAST